MALIYNQSMRTAQLFVTCLVDTFFPEVGEASVSVLRRAGVRVEFPRDQTCCGQPMFNAGLRASARRVAQHTISVFEAAEGDIVMPSGSCAHMIRHNYPEWALPEASAGSGQAGLASPLQEFDYQHEMYITRVEADRLLALGRIDQAEDYLEMRRRFINEHGYAIRRLNQAFFAFYGTYADTPGERGEDPVGPAVVALFEQCPSPGAFLRAVGKVTSLALLQQMDSSGRCG